MAWEGLFAGQNTFWGSFTACARALVAPCASFELELSEVGTRTRPFCRIGVEHGDKEDRTPEEGKPWTSCNTKRGLADSKSEQDKLSKSVRSLRLSNPLICSLDLHEARQENISTCLSEPRSERQRKPSNSHVTGKHQTSPLALSRARGQSLLERRCSVQSLLPYIYYVFPTKSDEKRVHSVGFMTREPVSLFIFRLGFKESVSALLTKPLTALRLHP
mmetsp:Transcript_32078/g.125029  ORF Transcript_32078/g.125029 Transcript_32078/m.125029 type:complete len:218 (+) Transcript_32078:3-656(+)